MAKFRGRVSVQLALPLSRRELPRPGAQQRRVIRARGQLLGQGRYLRAEAGRVLGDHPVDQAGP